MDSVQIWHVVVTSFEGVPYLKGDLKLPRIKNLWPVYVFSFSMEYTESNLRNFIQLLQLYVTGHR